MPRGVLPPTPASSLEITGKDGVSNAAHAGVFTLPSPAIAPANSNGRSSKPQPIRPAIEKRDFSLPPPPTRSRKIIQMKPAVSQKNSETSNTPPKVSGRKGTVGPTNSTTKKASSSSTAAGKKIARKTAHSVIERRRRSKMNEEFAVLKDLIPACKDQEMHKLAILSASIEYLRYLEQCVSNLKAANSSIIQPSPPAFKASFSTEETREDGEDDDDGDEDQDMEDTPTETPQSASTYRSVHSFTASPALSAIHASSSYASSVATLPSPAFGPAQYQMGYTHSASTSPTILPNGTHDADHEATAALLMLNKDRRDPKGASPSGRSMSVKDLLSTA